MNRTFFNKIKLNVISFNKVGEILRRVGEIQEPKEPKNFIKFAPYSGDVYPENFTPQPISIEADGDGGIIVFDDNVTEITVGSEAFCNAIPSSIEFCENVRYISSTAFDNCKYIEIKFNSMTPPEFIEGFGNITAAYELNGIIYHPTGSDYSSLRNVTTDYGNTVLFRNFEFVEFTPSSTPEEDSDFLEMHFTIPMDEEEWMGQVGYSGRVDGDFSEEYNKLQAFYENNKVYDVVPKDIMMEKSNITINGYKVESLSFDNWDGGSQWVFGTNAPIYPGGGNDFHIAKTYIDFECGGSPTAPEQPEGSDDIDLSIFPLYLTHDSIDECGVHDITYNYNATETTKKVYEVIRQIFNKNGITWIDAFEYGIELYLDNERVRSFSDEDDYIGMEVFMHGGGIYPDGRMYADTIKG